MPAPARHERGHSRDGGYLRKLRIVWPNQKQGIILSQYSDHGADEIREYLRSLSMNASVLRSLADQAVLMADSPLKHGNQNVL